MRYARVDGVVRVLKRAAPAGYTVSFSRHKRSWGWRRSLKANPEHDGVPDERWGFRTRNQALGDLLAELDRRTQKAAG